MNGPYLVVHASIYMESCTWEGVVVYPGLHGPMIVHQLLSQALRDIACRMRSVAGEQPIDWEVYIEQLQADIRNPVVAEWVRRNPTLCSDKSMTWHCVAHVSMPREEGVTT